MDTTYNTIEQAAADGKSCESTFTDCFRRYLSGVGAFPAEGINSNLGIRLTTSSLISWFLGCAFIF